MRDINKLKRKEFRGTLYKNIEIKVSLHLSLKINQKGSPLGLEQQLWMLS